MNATTGFNIEFRKATVADVDIAKQLGKAAIHHQCPGHYSPEHVAAWTAEPYPQSYIDGIIDDCYLVLIEGQLVGTGALILTSGCIESVFVHPDYQRRGIGNAIMQFLETLALSHGLVVLTLSSTLNAVPFYRAQGFVAREANKYKTSQGVELDCIPMQKLISLPGLNSPQ